MNKDYTIKRFTRKDSIFTLIAEEWNDGAHKYQRLRQVPKRKRSYGNVVLYGISPIASVESMWNFNELSKSKSFQENFYIDKNLSFSEKEKMRKSIGFEEPKMWQSKK